MRFDHLARLTACLLTAAAFACGDDESPSPAPDAQVLDAGFVIDDSGVAVPVDTGVAGPDAGLPAPDAAPPVDTGPVQLVLGGHWVTNGYGGGSDQFGKSVAIDGDRAFVGAPGVGGEGAVYVLEKIDDWWWPVSELGILLGSSGDALGWSVAVHGSTLAVGAPNRASLFSEAGEAFIFAETDEGWVERMEITRDPGSPMNAVGARGHFGHRIALSEDHLIVAAPAEGRSVSSGGVNPDVGAIYIYDRSSGGFSGPTAIRASGSDPDDFFSTGMSSDGRHIVASCIASPCDEKVYIFDAEADWAGSALTRDGPRLGPQVAVDDGLIAATHEGSDVVVFHQDETDAWADEGLLFEGDTADQEILEIAVSNPYVFVATGQMMSPGEGALWAFERTETGFEQLDRASLSSDWISDGFGSALFFDGQWGAVTSPLSDEGRGAAYFFTLVAGSCVTKSCAAGTCDSPPESDGCGGRLDCGGCSGSETCGGAGVPYTCGCAERVAGGPRGPTITSGSPIWMNTDRIEASDDSRAETGALVSNGSSGLLRAEGFGFAIPTDAAIEGIEVRIERLGDDSFEDQTIQLLEAGWPLGENRARIGRWGNSAGVDEVAVYGHPTDLWGETWTPEQINSDDFGVAFAARYEDTAGNGRIYVDQISVRVYYGVSCP